MAGHARLPRHQRRQASDELCVLLALTDRLRCEMSDSTPRSDQDWLVQALREESFHPGYSLVLKYGRPFKPAVMPADVEPGKKHCCFANAFRLASDRAGLRYVEGYALVRESLRCLNRHAWCIDEEDHVVDPTPGWGTKPLPRAFRGVVMPLWIAEPFAKEWSSGTLDGVESEKIETLAQLLGLGPV